jgi:hypothetical protein
MAMLPSAPFSQGHHPLGCHRFEEPSIRRHVGRNAFVALVGELPAHEIGDLGNSPRAVDEVPDSRSHVVQMWICAISETAITA